MLISKNQINRIDKCFAQLEQVNKKALVTFLTAGDPMLDDTLKLMHTMANNGADIIELGVPFSDPMADGVIIQRSSDRAVRAGINLLDIINIVEKFRNINQHTPIVLMGYANIFNYFENKLGTNHLAQKFNKAGIDGVLIVDMPPEYDKKAIIFKQHNIHNIYLISPTTTNQRIEYISKYASGYIYYVALKGVTGSKNINLAELTKILPAIKQKINLPITVGFGIDNAQTAKQIARHAHIVVGSKIISLLEQTDKNYQEQILKLFIQEIKSVL